MTEATLQVKYASQDLFVMVVDTAASMTNNLCDFSPSGTSFSNGGAASGFPFTVIGAKFSMTGAGGAGDTVKLQKVSGGSATDITDAVDVSAKANKAISDFGTFDTAQADINNGDNLRIVTASDALCRVVITCVKRQPTP